MTQPTIEQVKTAEAFLAELEEASLSHGAAVDLDNRLEEIVILRTVLRLALAEKQGVDRSLSIARDTLTAIMVLKPGSPEAATKQCAFVSKLAKEALVALAAQREG